MTWEKNVTRRAMAIAGDQPGALLAILLARLERCPGSLDAIADSVDQFADLLEAQSNAIRCEVARRQATAKLAEIVADTPK